MLSNDEKFLLECGIKKINGGFVILAQLDKAKKAFLKHEPSIHIPNEEIDPYRAAMFSLLNEVGDINAILAAVSEIRRKMSEKAAIRRN